jgi:hypothetical protein
LTLPIYFSWYPRPAAQIYFDFTESKDEEKNQGRLEFLPMEPPPPYNDTASLPVAAPGQSMPMIQPSQQPIQSHASMSSLYGGPQGSLPVNPNQPDNMHQNQQIYAPPAMIYQPVGFSRLFVSSSV